MNARALFRRPARGFTLLELVTALVMTGFLVAAAVSLLVSQQRSYQNGSGDRAMQEAGRVAMQAITDPLRHAGYGIDPQYALDLGPMDDVPQQGLPTGVRASFASYSCLLPVTCRDNVNIADELVFYSRNPAFSRPIRVNGVTATSINVTGDLTRSLLPGQVLEVMCLNGDRRRAYVTVDRRLDPPAVPDPAALVSIHLAGPQNVAGRPRFPFQNVLLLPGANSDDCFNVGPAVLAQVDRYRFVVGAFLDNGAAVLPGTPSSRPYLMLDQGLQDATGATILTPVASDVEDLQVAYIYPAPPAGGFNQVVGAQVGTPAAVEGLTVANPPAIDDPFDAPSRATFHPMNALAMRVSLVVRAPFADANNSSFSPDRPAAGNRDRVPLADGIRRARFEVSVPIPNLRTSNVPYCAIGAAPGMQAGGC